MFPHFCSASKSTRKAQLASAHFYGGYVGTTRAGYPLFVERLGKLDLEGVARDTEAREAVVDGYTCYLEGIFRTGRAMTAVEGKLARGVLVVDLQGASWSSIRHVSLLQGNSKIASDNYPEVRALVR